jgi:hypothetical protein
MRPLECVPENPPDSGRKLAFKATRLDPSGGWPTRPEFNRDEVTVSTWPRLAWLLVPEQMLTRLGFLAPPTRAARDPVRLGRTTHDQPDQGAERAAASAMSAMLSSMRASARLGFTRRGASVDAALPSLGRHRLYSTAGPDPPLATHFLHNR